MHGPYVQSAPSERRPGFAKKRPPRAGKSECFFDPATTKAIATEGVPVNSTDTEIDQTNALRPQCLNPDPGFPFRGSLPQGCAQDRRQARDDATTARLVAPCLATQAANKTRTSAKRLLQAPGSQSHDGARHLSSNAQPLKGGSIGPRCPLETLSTAVPRCLSLR